MLQLCIRKPFANTPRSKQDGIVLLVLKFLFLAASALLSIITETKAPLNMKASSGSRSSGMVSGAATLSRHKVN